MIDWPSLDELKQVLDVDSDVWDGAASSGEGPTRLSRLLEAAIARVRLDIGNWDDATDWPDAQLAQAAVQMAYLLSPKSGNLAAAAAAAANDPVYQALLFGHRRKFSVS